MDTTLRFLQQENSRLHEQNDELLAENSALRSYIAALKDLHRATQDIISEVDLFELISKILHNAMVILKAGDGSLMLLDEETDELVFVLVHSEIQQDLLDFRIPKDEGIAGWVAANKEPLIANNPYQDWRFSRIIDAEFNFATRSLIAVPMVTRDKLIGVIELLNKRNEEPFTDIDATLLLILGQVAATALEEMRIRLEAEAE